MTGLWVTPWSGRWGWRWSRDSITMTWHAQRTNFSFIIPGVRVLLLHRAGPYIAQSKQRTTAAIWLELSLKQSKKKTSNQLDLIWICPCSQQTVQGKGGYSQTTLILNRSHKNLRNLETSLFFLLIINFIKIKPYSSYLVSNWWPEEMFIVREKCLFLFFNYLFILTKQYI